MTAGEIAAEYRQAKQPLKQIGILADLNCCSKREIVEILRSEGCELPKNYAPKRRGGATAPSPAAAADPSPEARETGEAEADATEETVDAREALPIMIRHAAVAAIRRLYDEGEGLDEEEAAIIFRYATRGVLELVGEVERRCGATNKEDEP